MIDPTTKDEHLREIRAVYQTLRHDETNAHLALGWRLLKILVKDEEECVEFLLGWPSAEPPQKPPYDKEVRRFFVRDSEPRKYFTEDDQSA